MKNYENEKLGSALSSSVSLLEARQQGSHGEGAARHFPRVGKGLTQFDGDDGDGDGTIYGNGGDDGDGDDGDDEDGS